MRRERTETISILSAAVVVAERSSISGSPRRRIRAGPTLERGDESVPGMFGI
jgi:hypothetical protein